MLLRTDPSEASAERQTIAASLPRQPSPTGTEKNSTPSEAIQPAAVRHYQPRVKRPDLEPLDQLCTKILAFIEARGGRATASQLKRGLNSYRFAQLCETAIKKLSDMGAIRFEKEPGTRRQWIYLLKIPRKFKRTGPKPKRRRRRAASHRRTSWFENLLFRRKIEKIFDHAVDEMRKADSERRRAAARWIADMLAK